MGQIGRPHGVRGEVWLHTFTEDPLSIAGYGALESEDGSRQFEVEHVRAGSGGLVARLSGVADRSAAQEVVNVRLYVPRDRLPALAEAETYYHADLIGLAVLATDGAALGTIAAIHDFGAGQLLEIAPPSGPTVLVPFTKAAVPVVDLAASHVVADVPPELMETGRRRGRR